MNLHRLVLMMGSMLALTNLCTAFFREHLSERRDEDEKPKHQPGLFPSLLSHDHPRVISIFSKPADPNGPKRVGPGILGHLGNVMHGGTIGIQVQPLAGIQGIVGHAKKVITGGRDQVGQPNHDPEPPKGDHWEEPSKGHHWEKPPKDDHWQKPPRGDHWERPSKDEHWEKPPKDAHWERPSKGDHLEDEPEWEMKKPDKVPEPDKGGYSWDDIGEDHDGPSTEVPIEDIIMPRTRPRRFVESKIYHVQLTFRSNGKPYKVVERTQNSLDIREKQ